MYTTPTKLLVTAVYHPDFPPRARALGGKWDSTAKTWVFPSSAEQEVRKLAIEIYGTDGTPDDPENKLN